MLLIQENQRLYYENEELKKLYREEAEKNSFLRQKITDYLYCVVQGLRQG